MPKRNELDEDVRRFAGIVSPLRNEMPNELLQNIFLLTVSNTIDIDTPVETGEIAVREAWIITQVCRRWRAIALSFPSLWSVVALDFSPSQGCHFTESALKTHLQRSGSRPLTVIFVASPNGNSQIERRAFTLLAQQCSRWEAAALYIPLAFLPDLDCLHGQLPLLNALRIVTLGYDDRAREHAIQVSASRGFEIAPSLRSAYLGNRHILLPLSLPVLLPWSQLDWYRGENTWRGHLDALREAPQILCCSLITCAVRDQRDSDFELVCLPSLLRLALYDTEFLRLLETPVLDELVVFEHAAPVISLVHRSSCPLRRLFSFGGYDLSSIIGILEAAPTIVQLYVQVFDPLRPRDLDLFSRLASDPAFAPSLEVICLDVQLGPAEPIFLEAVEFRRRAGKLRGVTLFTRDPHLSLNSRVEALRADGLHFSISEGDAEAAWFPADLRFTDTDPDSEFE
ncbi:hypothetical protein B0H13DRAFT_2541252 [Mycena leptocephala]|nr:hypothetical protein B0H13DRAFT_2541252 [Mycena leptocephala]